MNEREESSEQGERPRASIFATAHSNNVPLKTIFVTIFSVAAVYLSALVLYRLRTVLLLMLLGGFVALLLNPLVGLLQRWKVPRRGTAVAIVSLGSLAVFLALAFAFGYPLVNSLTHLANELPAYVNKAQRGQGWIGHLLSRYHVKNWLDLNSTKLVSLAKGLSKPALALGRGAVSILFALVTMFAFVVLLLLEAPKIGAILLATMSPGRAIKAKKIAARVSSSTLGYMVGNMVTSVICGVVVFVTLSALHVPFAFLFALWVSLVDFLPQIGGAIAGIPTILFAFVHSVTAGVVTAVVFLAYTLIENHALNPVIMGRTVKLNPLSVFIAILVGAELGSWVGGIFGGFVGVLLAVPSAATTQVLVEELWKARSVTNE